jgi:ABC-type nitrate/sulfonate/bicarbonate transport system permease component
MAHQRERGQMNERLKQPLQALALPVFLVLCWQISSERGWINAFFFPAPTNILASAWRMLLDGSLIVQSAATLYRFTLGAMAGCVLGMATGIAMGVFDLARRVGQPFAAAMYTTPKVALLPLVMLILGIGDASRIALIAAVAAVIMSLQTLDAIRAVEPVYVEMARNYGAGTRDTVSRIYLPAALPQIFTGIRIAVSRSLVTLISLEMVSSTDGIGAMIWISWESLTTVRLYVAILAVIVFGLVMHSSLAWMEKVAVPWRKPSR